MYKLNDKFIIIIAYDFTNIILYFQLNHMTFMIHGHMKLKTFFSVFDYHEV